MSALFFSFVCWVLIRSCLSGPSWIPHHGIHLWDVNWFWLLRLVVRSTYGNRTEYHCLYSANPQAFSVIFQKAVLKAEPDEDLTQRVSNLIESITSSLFQYTTRGLFECDKLTYIAQLAFQVQAWNGRLICYTVCLDLPLRPGNPFCNQAEKRNFACWKYIDLNLFQFVVS